MNVSKHLPRGRRWPAALALAALGLALALPPVLAQPAAPDGRRGAVAQRANVTVNFVNADIEAVTRAMAAMIERQIAVDPRVRGTITVYSEQPQSVADAYQGYLSALRGLGFAVVDSGGLLKVVPEAEAKLQTGIVSVDEVGVRGDQVITQIFRLRHENPNNLVAVLRPLISANNTINANPASSSLVITDYAENLQRIARIIAALDQPAATDVEVVPLQHAVAADLVPLLQRLLEPGGPQAVPGAPGGVSAGSTLLAEPRSNAVIVRAPNAARLAAIKSTIARLDRPADGGHAGSGLWVVHLRNADAVRLATVLRAAFPAAGGSTGAGLPGAGSVVAAPPAAGGPGAAGAGVSAQAAAPVSAAAQPSTGGFIQADPATNSLIITAPEPLYRRVRAMIEQLDTRRAQVYIESMIVEVSGDDSADVGFQWQGLLGREGDRWGLGAGTNFNAGASGANNIISLSGALAGNAQSAPGEGLNIALLRNYGGTYALATVARALQSQGNTNIVSTPNLITLDNEEAKIVVGENVPFVTGQFTNTGTAVSNPFQTIERKDVGITLRIRPQIGEGGSIRMTLYQEQSSVKATTAAGTSNAGPSTTKRSIESTIVVDDGQIIVLGGLIEDRFVESESKVPLLGDLPGIGGLFRSTAREKRRSNLMVFLRPVVMRDADSASRLSLDRYDLIRGEQQERQPRPHPLLSGEAPVLPPAPERAPAPTPAPR